MIVERNLKIYAIPILIDYFFMGAKVIIKKEKTTNKTHFYLHFVI